MLRIVTRVFGPISCYRSNLRASDISRNLGQGRLLGVVKGLPGRFSTGEHVIAGRTEEIEGRAVERWAGEVAEQHGYTEVDHTVELFGCCAQCSSRP